MQAGVGQPVGAVAPRGSTGQSQLLRVEHAGQAQRLQPRDCVRAVEARQRALEAVVRLECRAARVILRCRALFSSS